MSNYIIGLKDGTEAMKWHELLNYCEYIHLLLFIFTFTSELGIEPGRGGRGEEGGEGREGSSHQIDICSAEKCSIDLSNHAKIMLILREIRRKEFTKGNLEQHSDSVLSFRVFIP